MAVRRDLYHPEEVRAKIKTSQLVNRLQEFIFGTVEMSKSQVSAAIGLLRKTMPDLSAMTVSGSLDLVKPEELSDAQLADIVIASRRGTIKTPSGEEESSELH
jgi:hypothetical protein